MIPPSPSSIPIANVAGATFLAGGEACGSLRSICTSLVIATLLLAACGGQPAKPVEESSSPAATPVPEKKSASAVRRGGGFYLDDGPLDTSVDLASIPDAVPRNEPPHRFANRPYSVLGKDYVPMQSAAGYRQRGVASWYGRRYHGQKTSSGEPYDMFGMTAAHPTLPIPSYVRVTRPENGKSVVVRVNDRGPFLHNRVIDLSYTAAWKLGIVENGSGTVLVESVMPGKLAPPAPAIEATLPVIADNRPSVLNDIEEKSGHYLQLGAFGNRDNAESLKAKLGRDLGDLGDKLVVRSAGNLHRLQLGPLADAAEARRIAEQLKLAFDLPSVLVK
jgi:rare lipoprotein A